MLYDRKIKYLDVYENGERIQNAGYVRLEVQGDKVNLQIRVEKLKATDVETVPVRLLAEDKEAVLGEVLLNKGSGMLECSGMPIHNLAGDIGYRELCEILLKLSERRVVRGIIREGKLLKVEEVEEAAEEAIVPSVPELPCEDEIALESLALPLLIQEAEENGEELPQLVPQREPAPILRPMSVPPVQGKPANTTKWQQLSDIYPHIRPFQDGRDYLKIKPEDFVVLTKKYYSLTGNSFLKHGYYNYEHLILTREMGEDGERYYVGVPGNFYEKEKQVAVLFGFESFEGKQEPAGRGDFGYYMIRVEI